jgi:uncharacterized protein GlcG (DUF336 family)
MKSSRFLSSRLLQLGFARWGNVATAFLSLALAATFAVNGFAQMLNPYGPSVTLDEAKRAAAPALAEATKNGWTVAVAVVDPSGNLVYYEKMDNTQLGSATVAVDKARSAALFKRPTKAFQDAMVSGPGGARVLSLHGATPIEGGIPLLVEGKIVGAIGVSGAASARDAQCAKAGADILK